MLSTCQTSEFLCAVCWSGSRTGGLQQLFFLPNRPFLFVGVSEPFVSIMAIFLFFWGGGLCASGKVGVVPSTCCNNCVSPSPSLPLLLPPHTHTHFCDNGSINAHQLFFVLWRGGGGLMAGSSGRNTHRLFPKNKKSVRTRFIVECRRWVQYVTLYCTR